MEDIPQALRSSGQPGNPGRERRETFNPTIKQSVIDRAYEDDPAVAASEWGGKFRDDLESYVSPEVVDQCTEPNCTLRPYQPGIQYISHCDPSGIRRILFALRSATSKTAEAFLIVWSNISRPSAPRRPFRICALFCRNIV
jgi:hypothetical protein